MGIRGLALLACLAFALPAAAETVYKYRNPDGTMIYSNRMLRNAELVETFDYNFPPAAAGTRSISSVRRGSKRTSRKRARDSSAP